MITPTETVRETGLRLGPFQSFNSYEESVEKARPPRCGVGPGPVYDFVPG